MQYYFSFYAKRTNDDKLIWNFHCPFLAGMLVFLWAKGSPSRQIFSILGASGTSWETCRRDSNPNMEISHRTMTQEAQEAAMEWVSPTILWLDL